MPTVRVRRATFYRLSWRFTFKSIACRHGNRPLIDVEPALRKVAVGLTREWQVVGRQLKPAGQRFRCEVKEHLNDSYGSKTGITVIMVAVVGCATRPARFG